MDSIETAIMNALEINMGYKPEERVVIVSQKWGNHLREETTLAFAQSAELARKMFDVYNRGGVDVTLLSYVPSEARSGVDAPLELRQRIRDSQNPDIVFMATPYSLTHTGFRKSLTDLGARVASMPGFRLDMFEEGGPMSVNYEEVHKATERIAELLRHSRYVSVTGPGTDITVQTDTELIRVSSGLMREKGDWGNLPGAEAYVVPVHEGNSKGKISVPAGWGGPFPLEHEATFHIRNGRFVAVMGHSQEAQVWLNKHVPPLVSGEKDHNILAELGIGTNPSITSAYIEEHGWSTLTAEKIIGSVHFANGNSASMGGKNDVPVHHDWVVPNVEIQYH